MKTIRRRLTHGTNATGWAVFKMDQASQARFCEDGSHSAKNHYVVANTLLRGRMKLERCKCMHEHHSWRLDRLQERLRT